jgi:hypothetical protein
MLRRLGNLLLLILAVMGSGCPSSQPAPPALVEQAPAPPAPTRKFDFRPSEVRTTSAAVEVVYPQFEDAARELGIDYTYDNGTSPKALMVESTGGGCGWGDFDRDGWLDLYLPQGGQPDAIDETGRPNDCLYRQRSGRFADCSAQSGIREQRYSQGVSVGDFDNDGFDDIFVANVGTSRLWHNQGDGTFEDATHLLTGLKSIWCSTPAWGDVDKDGDLDLYVCCYADYDPYHPKQCLDKEGIASVCHPRNVDPVPDQFFLNLDESRFEESSQSQGLSGPGNRALGVVIADLNGDDWPDIYVANDTTANFYFVNERASQAHFHESALLLGGGYAATGEAQASMGVAFADYDNNGFPDLCLSHFTGEHNTLYQNSGPNGLADVSAMVGLRDLSLPKLGFGIVMADFNGDAQADMFIANGHIDPRYADGEGYRMKPQLHSFDGTRWRDAGDSGGPYFRESLVGRGVATADYDQDGDIDLCVVHQNSPLSILRNESRMGRVLSIRPIGRQSNRNGLGVKVRVQYNGIERKLELAGGTSYAASHERAVWFGIGDWTGPVHVSIAWPSGQNDQFDLPSESNWVTVVEGLGPVALPQPDRN